MLDFLGTIVTAALMVVVVNAVVTYLEIGRIAKLMVASIAGLWIGLAAAAAGSGWMRVAQPFPVIGIFVATPLVAAAIASAWPAARAALSGLPMRLLIGLNIARVFGVFFLLLAMQGRLAGPFPFFAGWGDIITGVFALLLLLAAVDAEYSGTIAAWNLFGVADLVLAIFLGVTSAVGSPFQLFSRPPGSAAMQYLPWSFVPTVLVPFYLIMHATIWAQLRTLRAGARSPQSPMTSGAVGADPLPPRRTVTDSTARARTNPSRSSSARAAGTC
jgi:hypothetical protein